MTLRWGYDRITAIINVTWGGMSLAAFLRSICNLEDEEFKNKEYKEQ